MDPSKQRSAPEEEDARARAAEGLRRLAASAALIKATLAGSAEFEQGRVVSPQLRILGDGEIEAWVELSGACGWRDMFEGWSAPGEKFGRLAFGFACDHFKMLHPAYHEKLRAQASESGTPVVVRSRPFGVGAAEGLSDATPEAMTAPALMALCQRMASAPEWLMQALDDLERGRAPRRPPPAPRRGVL
jgi:hypothetical protein